MIPECLPFCYLTFFKFGRYHIIVAATNIQNFQCQYTKIYLILVSRTIYAQHGVEVYIADVVSTGILTPASFPSLYEPFHQLQNVSRKFTHIDGSFIMTLQVSRCIQLLWCLQVFSRPPLSPFYMNPFISFKMFQENSHISMVRYYDFASSQNNQSLMSVIFLTFGSMRKLVTEKQSR